VVVIDQTFAPHRPLQATKSPYLWAFARKFR